MADDQDLDKDDTEGEDGAEESTGLAGKKKGIILVIGIVVLVAISIGVTLTAMHFLSDDEVVQETGEADASEVDDESESAETSEDDAVLSPAIYYPLKPVFIVNYNVRGRQRFLQIEMTLLLRDNEVVPTIDLHVPAIRNNIIMLLRGQSYEELQTAEGKELVRQQILITVQDVIEKEIGEPGIEQVLFTNLVMQ